MATNNITSGKAPARRGRKPIYGTPNYQGDDILEHAAGENRRLATIQAQPITGLTDATQERLLKQAGVSIRRTARG
jgi:hypothetical protein